MSINPAEEAAAFEAITFVVKKSGSEEKAGGIRVGRVEMTSANSKGTSKIVIVGSETLTKEYRLGEFFEMSLKQVKAPE